MWIGSLRSKGLGSVASVIDMVCVRLGSVASVIDMGSRIQGQKAYNLQSIMPLQKEWESSLSYACWFDSFMYMV